MLSDDITGAVGKTASMTGAVISGAVRGALIGAVVAVAGVALVAAAGPILGLFGIGAAAGGLAGVVPALSVAFGGTATASAAAIAGGMGAFAAIGAKIGAAVLGVTSIIPGTSELMGDAKSGFKNLFTRRAPEVEYAGPPPVEVVHVPAPRHEIVYDNPAYEPGKGTALMQKGDALQTTTVCR